jgi:Acyl-CoA synthetases (AMP-forming)/AMP-acid ligases II
MDRVEIERNREAKVFGLKEVFAPEERTFPQIMTRQAERYGDRRLVTFGDRSLSFAETKALAGSAGHMLREAGIKPGDTVAIMCSNRIEFLTAFLGCAWSGAIAVPINNASRGAQLEHILKNCGARLAIVEASFLNVFGNLPTDLPLQQIWTIGNVPADIDLKVKHAPLPEATGHIEAHPCKPSGTVAILYTSGTTGLSKGVCCPHAQYFWWGVHTAALLGIDDDDVLLTCLPLFHTNALNTFYQALLTGAPVTFEPKFSVSRFWTSLAESGATVTYLLGAMVPMLLSKEASPADRAHKTRIALAPGVPPQFHGPFTERFGVEILEGYGSTETNFVIGSLYHEQKPGRVGKARPGFDLAVFDESDNSLSPGTPGELVVRPHEPFSTATGYFGMPEKTIEAWRNLWFHTGDRVVMDSDGYIQFLDRMKDAIRRRGENISSYEVEQVIVAHPAVENVAVFPVQSELAEDEVMAAIVLKQGASVTPAELLDFCQPRMSYFSVPRFIDFVTELPLTENGKVQKYKLTAKGVTENTWDREKAGYKLTR